MGNFYCRSECGTTEPELKRPPSNVKYCAVRNLKVKPILKVRLKVKLSWGFQLQKRIALGFDAFVQSFCVMFYVLCVRLDF